MQSIAMYDRALFLIAADCDANNNPRPGPGPTGPGGNGCRRICALPIAVLLVAIHGCYSPLNRNVCSSLCIRKLVCFLKRKKNNFV